MLQRILAALVATAFCLSSLLGCDTNQPAPTIPRASPPEASAPANESALAVPGNHQRTAGNPAADVKLVILDCDGVNELITSHRGKVVVMDAWSTWCPPCVKEFPGLVKLHDQYGPEQVACISLSLDFDGIGNDKPENHRDEVLAFLQQQRATFDNVLAGEPSDDVARKLDFGSPPAVFVYDQEGNLAQVFKNQVSYDEVGKLVAELLLPKG